ncbi:hypothetical protein GCM10007276_20350 [Agaricicola taiwanensis]|uniref:Uncharacterized protein n=1 Tax=Agaricicola taiwanensis TaxID=591372 RepID=A0A8J2YHL8_9RHOB|nr:hypothetical protein [Agaricicola taiwanensis]GGE43026.1 hypothetical protein GCM10007276_20350 [Agaricicola taiwanensis]
MRDNPLKDEDFETIEAAVLETARGRWFLAEYARRQRLAETADLAQAIERLETRLLTQRSSQEMERIQIELIDLARAIHQARNDVMTAFGVTKSKASAAPGESRAAAAQRAATALRYLENRIQIIMGQAGMDAFSGPEPVKEATEITDVAAPSPAEKRERSDADAASFAESGALAKAALPEAITSAQPSGEIAADGDNVIEDELFGDEPEGREPSPRVNVPKAALPRLDNHEHLATTLRAAIAQVRGPSSDIDALSFEAKSVLFA